MDSQETTNQRNAGRDLMPIIVIFIFAIVMTFVILAILSYFKGPSAKTAAKAEIELEDMIANGEKAFSERDWNKAKQAYLQAIGNLDQRKKENPEILLLRVELYSRLAETAVKRQDMKAAENYADKMKQYRTELSRQLDIMQSGAEAGIKSVPAEKEADPALAAPVVSADNGAAK